VAQLSFVRSIAVRHLLLPSLLLAALLQSCAQDRSYVISLATQDDAAKTRRLLRDVAAEAGLPQGAGADQTLGDYSMFNVSVHARSRGDQINVWLSRTDWPPHKHFRGRTGF
jgi:hypothetical protein